ncbi:DUF2852 domain-containing protein [Stappia taiwanensis]|uniref:DUF2852 domain-containing protein n=1 Tax=Stappia taiwanensis TaxID=992267 RepID=A0A838XY16_9HYPH|nr:DUF2852 domain-containing protein [Stappia taiwanensis]MBA4611783.1 DUF2852 domain-containing protein [Stappia taiwanensis]GGF02753.1 membrane protein [Stappia taiwanensis]
MTCTSTLRPGWSPLTIGLMVLGFIVFWPLGLAMLAYILWGDRFHSIAGNARAQWQASPLRDTFQATAPRTGNSAFDAYRERELKRLEEERQRIEAMRAEFDSFLQELRRAKDQEEFDRFMASRGRTPAGPEHI